MNNSYSNVGKHLQTLAKVITMLIDIIGCLIGFLFFSVHPIIGFLIIAIFLILGYFSSILLRAFGVLVESVVNIDRTLESMAIRKCYDDDDYDD